jgi:hypothetical protein
MLAMLLGLRAMRFAPPSRVARVLLKENTHDAWALRSELNRVLAEIRREDPAWFSEFVHAGQQINPQLLQELL